VEIRTIAVIGSGIMGNGIAQVSAAAGYQVFLQDISQSALDKALKTIRHSLDRLVQKERLDPPSVKKILNRISPTIELADAVKNAEYVIEAATENLELKYEIFKEMDRLTPEQAIFGSNTSQYSITALGAVTDRPAQIIGTHFFNPPVLMHVIEVVKGLETSEGCTPRIT